MRHLLPALKEVFTLDLRALGLMRICVAFVLLLDLYTRSTDLEAHYANTGVLPLHLLFEHAWNPYHFSFHTMSGLWQVQAVLFALNALVALSLLLGYHTRLSTFGCWLFLMSVQNRNPLILQGGDDLLRLVLFWAIFLPWGRFYSLDARNGLTNSGCPGTTCLSAACAAYVTQIVLMYFFTAQLKSSPEWTTDGTALYYALSLDQITLPLGKLIYPYPLLLRALTFLTLYVELWLPFLLFVPYKNQLFRLLVIGVLAGFHLGVSLTLFVGLFYLISTTTMVGLLPPSAMNWLDPRLRKAAARIAALWHRLRQQSPALPQRLALPALPALPAARPFQGQLSVGLNSLLVLLVAYSCWWNADNAHFRYLHMPEAYKWLGYTIRLDQNWGMFAPAVFKDDGWFILEARTADAQLLDLNRGGTTVTYKKPASVVSLFKNDRWRKYSENYLFVFNSYMRPYYCNYMLRLWREAQPKGLEDLKVVYMKEVTQPDYRPVSAQREVLCECAGR